MPRTRIAADAPLDARGLPAMTTVLDGRERPPVAGRKDWAIRSGRYTGGLSDGVTVVEINNGPLSVLVLPTRGMGIWKVLFDGQSAGWDAPAKLPVHPHFVNLQGRNGFGWLEGFNELLCRCGLSHNGPPGHDDGVPTPVESDVSQHGRISNLPARDVEYFVDDEAGAIGISGVVDECVLFGPQFQLRTTLTVPLGGMVMSLRDEVINVGSLPTELSLLYHINVGPPFLDGGAVLETAASRVMPRDARAVEGVATYSQYLPATTGYAEQVYYYDLKEDPQGRATAMLRNKAADRAFGLTYTKKQLPSFSLWKCTQDSRSGYVTGLEPGTNHPNFKSFERHHGRVISLPPGASHVVEMQLEIHATSAGVQQMSERIRSLQGSTPPKVHPQPGAPFAPID